MARAAFREKRQVAAAIAAIETPALDESAASAATEELKGDDGKDKPDTVGGASEPTALEAELVEAPADAASNELQSKETAREATESKAAEVLAEAAGSGTGPDAESPEQPTEELDYGESDEAGEDGAVAGPAHTPRKRCGNCLYGDGCAAAGGAEIGGAGNLPSRWPTRFASGLSVPSTEANAVESAGSAADAQLARMARTSRSSSVALKRRM